ncbi:MAG: MarR family transcriptional regulator [Clostridia bacterium]|nr:MarR family transcriptional regulator [Clostridia bacterium]
MIQRFQSFMTAITICYKHLQKIKSTEMTEYGLKGSHVMCLFFLHHHSEGLTAAQLCQLCAEDKAAISRSLASLHEKGLIEVDGQKKYRALIRLTEKGEEMSAKLDGLIETWVGYVGNGLSEQDRRAFYYGLTVISNNLREGAESLANK